MSRTNRVALVFLKSNIWPSALGGNRSCGDINAVRARVFSASHSLLCSYRILDVVFSFFFVALGSPTGTDPTALAQLQNLGARRKHHGVFEEPGRVANYCECCLPSCFCFGSSPQRAGCSRQRRPRKVKRRYVFSPDPRSRRHLGGGF